MTDNTTNTAEIVPLWNRKAKMQNSPIKELRDYWQELRAGRLVPLRSEIDPRAIASALECGFIVERTAPGAVRFRLAGMHLSDLMGMEVRGMPLRSFIAPAARADFAARLENVFDAPEVHEYQLISDTPGGPPLIARMLLLPLKSDQGQVDRAIGCISTEGNVGVPPRRFRITETMATSLTTGRNVQEIMVPGRQPQLAGFGEQPVVYKGPPDAPKTEDGKPFLRLVKSDLREI
ncbi:PAS domain-containing protein [Litoreibacter roseus]|uniref:PAS domain-containing protein n=1 Tax=Litoreibacter roseus TaxID=2601869 RepID=A0A6N6JKE2_9RHOB|nr:PAS domain-containing protein [Litoreibacter roseus]GFE66786.1 PAS domain-containing protein [Litoreibacter roseus]